jgi:hypothetical protein
MTSEPTIPDSTEALRLVCDAKRRNLRDVVNQNGDVNAAAKVFAEAFNAYQEARAQQPGMKVKRVSAFHILKNLGQIIGSIKD